MIQEIINRIKTQVRLFLAKKYTTIMSPKIAKFHNDHGEKCKKNFKETFSPNQDIDSKVEEYLTQGFTSIWSAEQEEIASSLLDKIKQWENDGLYWKDGIIDVDKDVYNSLPKLEIFISKCLKDFLKKTFKSHYKIFFARFIKTSHDPNGPSGSQLWHQDGGPGTALNGLFYLDEIDKDGGAIELVRWNDSLKLFKKVSLNNELRKLYKSKASRLDIREKKVEVFSNLLSENSDIKIFQPIGKKGLFVPFRNNLVHKGGFPTAPGKDRYVLLFYFYPSMSELPVSRYREEGFPKKGSYPENPEF